MDLTFELREDAFVAHVSMNLVFLDYVMPSFRESPDRMEVSELAAATSALRRRMGEICRVTIDGAAPDPALVPQLTGLAVNDPDESLVPLFPKSGLRGLRKIKFDLLWPATGSPRAISIVWGLYPPDELSILVPPPSLRIASELSAEGVRTQIEFREDEPEFVWRSLPGGSASRLLHVPTPVTIEPWRISGLAIGAVVVAAISGFRAIAHRRHGQPTGRLLGLTVIALAAAPALWFVPIARVAIGRPTAGLPSPEAAAEIFRPLHENLYRAFDFTEESTIYDALARSVDGPLLEEMYLAIHRSLVMQEEGGAMSRVRAVRELDLRVESVGIVDASGSSLGSSPGALPERLPGFSVMFRYQVDGRVTHWGHSHDRTNEYRTRYLVVARDGVWHIAQSEVLEQARVDGLEGTPTPSEVGPDGSFDA